MGSEVKLNEDLVRFISYRLDEVKRMCLVLGVTNEMNAQAAVDQLDRLRASVESIVFYTQYYDNNPITIPILKKVANNWSYHPDFKEEWRIGQRTFSNQVQKGRQNHSL